MLVTRLETTLTDSMVIVMTRYIIIMASLYPDTDNELATSQGGYDNISVPWRPAQPSLEFLQYLHNQIQPGDVSADCILIWVISGLYGSGPCLDRTRYYAEIGVGGLFTLPSSKRKNLIADFL